MSIDKIIVQSHWIAQYRYYVLQCAFKKTRSATTTGYKEAKPGLTFKMKNVQGLFLFDKIYKLKTTM